MECDLSHQVYQSPNALIINQSQARISKNLIPKREPTQTQLPEHREQATTFICRDRRVVFEFLEHVISQPTHLHLS